jgi:hypothetical protein
VALKQVWTTLWADGCKATTVNDCATLRPLLDELHQHRGIEKVLADAEVDGERNHCHIRELIQAESIIEAKRAGNIRGIRAQMCGLSCELYRQRVHAEIVSVGSNAHCPLAYLGARLPHSANRLFARIGFQCSQTLAIFRI